MSARSEPMAIPSGGLRLEGVLDLPDTPAGVPGVVMCHPHPLYGGQMDDAVLAAVAEGLVGSGMAVLRFNFRGVGASEGEHDGGRGEVDDALAALAAVSGAGGVDGGRVGIAGYSFGAGVALRAALRGQGVRAVALIACPGGSLGQEGVSALSVPKLLLSGSRDDFTPADRFLALAGGFGEPKEVNLVEGANHFFREHTEEVAERVGRFFGAWLLRGRPPGGSGGP